MKCHKVTKIFLKIHHKLLFGDFILVISSRSPRASLKSFMEVSLIYRLKITLSLVYAKVPWYMYPPVSCDSLLAIRNRGKLSLTSIL